MESCAQLIGSVLAGRLRGAVGLVEKCSQGLYPGSMGERLRAVGHPVCLR